MINQALNYIAERRVMTREAIMEAFSPMVFEGLVSKGYAERSGELYRVSDAGRRLLADKES
jgi:hypothetical protein